MLTSHPTRRRRIIRTVPAALFTALTLAGSACSDDAASSRDVLDPAAGPSAALGTVAAEPAVTAPTTAAPTTAAPAATVVAPVDGGGDGGDFCDRLLEASSAFDLLGLEAVEGQTPDEVEADFATAVAVMGALVQEAPTDLVDPLERLRQAFETTRTYYERYDFDLDELTAALAADPALADEYVASLAALDADGQFDAGLERLTAYQSDVCGIDE